MRGFLDLPESILVFVLVRYLNVHQILKLRLLNKKCYNIFSSDTIWTLTLEREWLSFDPLRYLCKAVVTKPMKIAVDIDLLTDQLYKAIRADDQKTILFIFNARLDRKYQQASLLKVIERLSEERFQNMRYIFRAKHLMYCSNTLIATEEVLRFKCCAELKYKYEKASITLDRVIPEFHDVIPLREKIWRQVWKRYDELIQKQEIQQLIKEGSNGRLVSEVYSILEKVASAQKSDELELPKDSVLAVYNGFDAKEDRKIDVLTGICQEMGFDIKITRHGVLRIKDETFPGGYCYSDGTTTNMMSAKELVKRYPERGGYSEQRKAITAFDRTREAYRKKVIRQQQHSGDKFVPGYRFGLSRLYVATEKELYAGRISWFDFQHWAWENFRSMKGDYPPPHYSYQTVPHPRLIRNNSLFPETYFGGTHFNDAVLPDTQKFRMGELVYCGYGSCAGVVLFAFTTDKNVSYQVYLNGRVKECKELELANLHLTKDEIIEKVESINQEHAAGFFFLRFDYKTSRFIISDYIAVFEPMSQLFVS